MAMTGQQDRAGREPTAAGALVGSLLGWVAGTAWQLGQPALWPAAAYGGLLAGTLAAVVLAARQRERWGRRGVALLAGLVLGFGVSGLRATWLDAQRLAPVLEGRDLVVTGVVAAMPQRDVDSLRFRLAVEAAREGDRPVELPRQILLSWYGSAASDDDVLADARTPAALRAGERWQMTVRLKAPHGNANPHGFDYELWLWEQGLQATGYVRDGPKDPAAQRLEMTGQYPVEAARQAVRDALYARIAADDPQRQRVAGILAALVTGDQNAIARGDWDVFRATGVAHLMSISGLHITLFAWVAAALLGALWRRTARWGWRWCLAVPAPTAALVGGIVLAAAYALFSGWGVPAQRTVGMLATVGLLRMGGRQWPWPVVWLLACAAVVAIDPWALLQAGFWLSFVAVGVLFASGAGGRDAHETQAAGPSGAATAVGRSAARVGRRAAALWREHWVVTLALTPLSLLLFGQVSLVGLLANAVAIPWVTLVLTPLALAGVVVPGLWELAAWTLVPALAALQWLADWPWATASTPAPALWAAVAGVTGGVLLALRLPWGLRALGLPLLLPVLLWQAPRPASGQFELLAADVGQGSAVLVRTAGHTLLYDAGPRFSAESDAGQRVMVPLLRALGERVDTLVLSHSDTDHTGGARAVLAMQPQAQLMSSLAADHALPALRAGTRCEAGQRWTWDGVQFEVLHPAAPDYDGARRANALSCVLRVGNGAQAALLAGDIESAQEAGLAGSPFGPRLRADVLLVPHHGSKTSSSAAFLDAVRPRWALVQAGYRNRFGHPAPAVLGRYAERGIAVIESPRCGAANWSSAAPQKIVCQREQAMHYWQHPLP